ncbi:MAG: PhzF family phenazine biosynthesis isomerase, partial [Thermoplasmata archaeon]|nr:PhzF family phenazine biosynthesis isomerase [Thermoplasmata archaeon]
DIDGHFPIQEVSTGLPILIVPLRTLEALRRVRVSRTVLEEMMQGLEARCVLCFTTETYSRENDLNVRVFADPLGIPEDPATGSGNGCLAAYLVEHGVLGKDAIDIRVEQGFEIGRPSMILLRAERKEGGGIDVRVGGKVQLVARGELI